MKCSALRRESGRRLGDENVEDSGSVERSNENEPCEDSMIAMERSETPASIEARRPRDDMMVSPTTTPPSRPSAYADQSDTVAGLGMMNDEVAGLHDSSSDRQGEGNGNDNNPDEVSTAVPTLVEVSTAVPTLVEAIEYGEGEEDEDGSSLGVSAGEQGERPGEQKRHRRKCLAFAVILWILQLVMVLGLKRAGVVEFGRIEEVVVQRVLPQLEQSWMVQRVLPQLEQSWHRLNESMAVVSPLGNYYLQQEKKTRPGYQLRERGARAHYPVLMIPGFVTSGLQVWGGKECARKYFRQRFWAGLFGARSLFMERDCWLEHMMLHPHAGGDPHEDVRIRAAEGFDAADFFVPSYWVWARLIENLADVGYTPSTMSMEPYDWRLSFAVLEERDGYLTKLKHKIEAMHETTGRKVVLTSHSMGALLVHYFFAWVSADKRRGGGGGGGGKDWVDRHVHACLNIAGSHLGVPKAATALLSGEMSDTVFVGAMGKHVVEQFFGRKLRRDLWNTWGSVWAMLPKGGDAVWGAAGADMCITSSGSGSNISSSDVDSGNSSSSSPGGTDPFCPLSGQQGPSILALDVPKDGSIIRTDEAASSETVAEQNTAGSAGGDQFLEGLLDDFAARKVHSTEDILDFLQAYGGGLGPDTAAARLYSLHGNEEAVENPSSRTWHDPTRTPLPHAPNLRIYCLYGTGLDTERAYYYKRNTDDVATATSAGGASAAATPGEPGNNRTSSTVADVPFVLDSALQREDQNVRYGIRYANGDGSVPLVSLGYVCADAWRREDSGLNPAGARVITREYRHRSEFCVDDPMRGGPESADHVDILGNVDMTTDFLRVVTDFDVDKVDEDRIVSDIQEISRKINERAALHGNGVGIPRNSRRIRWRRRPSWLRPWR